MELVADINGSACLETRGCVGIETANDETTNDQRSTKKAATRFSLMAAIK